MLISGFTVVVSCFIAVAQAFKASDRSALQNFSTRPLALIALMGEKTSNAFKTLSVDIKL